MKKGLIFLLIAILTMSMFAGCSSKGSDDSDAQGADKTMTIGFSQDKNDIEWTQRMKDEIMQYGEENGVKITATNAAGSGEKQISDIEDLITLGVDAIIIHTYHADLVGNAVKDALDADIPVIVLASEIPGVEVTSNISTDSIKTGNMMGEYVLKRFPDGANIVQITGKEGSLINQMRGQGFRDIIDPTGKYKVLAELSANYERSVALKVMEDQLNAHGGDIDMVYCHNDDMALGAIQAIEEAGYKANIDDGIVVVSAADGIYPEVLQAVEEGKMITAYFPTFAKEGVETAIKAANGEQVEKKQVVDSEVITKENVDTYK